MTVVSRLPFLAWLAVLVGCIATYVSTHLVLFPSAVTCALIHMPAGCDAAAP